MLPPPRLFFFPVKDCMSINDLSVGQFRGCRIHGRHIETTQEHLSRLQPVMAHQT
jgi:hypothetical protein